MANDPKALKTKALKLAQRLPTLSPMIGKLLFYSSSADCDLNQIGQLAEHDTALSAEFIHMANSGLYARIRRVTSVRHAVALIGIGAVRRYALTYSVSRLFGRLKPAPSFPLPLFNLHSTAVAALADFLAAELPTPDRDSAFAAGLFHDFGRLLLAVTAQRDYESALGLSQLTGRPIIECEREVFGLDHVELTCAALDPWGVPAAVVNAIDYGHHPEDDPGARPGIVALSDVLSKADEWVNFIGISLAPRQFGEHQALLRFAEHVYPRDSVLQRFDAELASLSNALGYKGHLVRGAQADPVVRDFLNEAHQAI